MSPSSVTVGSPPSATSASVTHGSRTSVASAPSAYGTRARRLEEGLWNAHTRVTPAAAGLALVGRELGRREQRRELLRLSTRRML